MHQLLSCFLSAIFYFYLFSFPFLGSSKDFLLQWLLQGNGQATILHCFFYIFPSYHLPNSSFQVNTLLLQYFLSIFTFIFFLQWWIYSLYPATRDQNNKCINIHHMPLGFLFLLFHRNIIFHSIYCFSLFSFLATTFYFSQNLGKFVAMHNIYVRTVTFQLSFNFFNLGFLSLFIFVIILLALQSATYHSYMFRRENKILLWCLKNVMHQGSTQLHVVESNF